MKPVVSSKTAVTSIANRKTAIVLVPPVKNEPDRTPHLEFTEFCHHQRDLAQERRRVRVLKEGLDEMDQFLSTQSNLTSKEEQLYLMTLRTLKRLERIL